MPSCFPRFNTTIVVGSIMSNRSRAILPARGYAVKYIIPFHFTLGFLCAKSIRGKDG